MIFAWDILVHVIWCFITFFVAEDQKIYTQQQKLPLVIETVADLDMWRLSVPQENIIQRQGNTIIS